MDISTPQLPPDAINPDLVPDAPVDPITNDERLQSIQNRTFSFFETVLTTAMDLFSAMSTQEKIKFCQSSLPALAKMMTMSESDEIQAMRDVVGELQREMRERLIA